MDKQQEFEATNKGKCDTCNDHKMLDTMVRKGKKGLYECIDCKVNSERETIDDYLVLMKSQDDEEIHINAGKLKKIIRWVVG